MKRTGLAVFPRGLACVSVVSDAESSLSFYNNYRARPSGLRAVILAFKEAETG